MSNDEVPILNANGGHVHPGVPNPVLAGASGLFSLKPPEQLDFHSPNLQQRWKKWREETELYLDLSTDGKSEDTKVKYFKYLIGPQGREVYETLNFDDGTLASVVDAFEKYCNPSKSETVERYKFFTRYQETCENYDKYITDLKVLASTCNFGTLNDSLIRDKIVCGITDKHLRERLLREDGLNLDKCVRLCRASELSKEQLKTLDTAQTVHSVRVGGAMQKKKKGHSKTPQGRGGGSRSNLRESPKSTVDNVQCKFCGHEHERNRNSCPAFGKTCFRCKRKNHMAAMCQQQPKQRVHAVDEEVDDEYFVINSLTLSDTDNSVNQVQDSGYPRQIFASMDVAGQSVSFQVDTGATCNLIPKSLLPPDTRLLPTTQVLRTYDKSIVKPVGKCQVKMINPKDGSKYKVDFVVLKEAAAMPILGSCAAQSMNLITVQHENILKMVADPSSSVPSMRSSPHLTVLNVDSVKEEFSEVFSGTGLFEGSYTIKLDPTAVPVVHPPRRVPLTLKPKLKEELQRLEDLQIITPVTEPTPWVSSLVIVEKANKLRVCIDPKDLNGAIKRSHYPLRTIEDIIPDLGKAKIFSVVDAKNGFWHVALDEESSYLTTFNTPFGRFRWLRMPFGISSAPEEFQRRQDQIIEGLNGVRGVADDILIYGEGDSIEEASVDHDANFRSLMERCRERNLKINPTKMKFKVQEVSFIGHRLTSKGLEPDPGKTQAVLDMPKPTDVAGVLRFVGFVNYLGKFLPHLSETCEPLRKLTLKDVEWHWDKTHDDAIDKVKRLVVGHPVLRFFDSKVQVTLQCDASMAGLGAALLQNGQPVAYASRALTDTETRYAQIEKELLAVVYGMEKFHQFTYGRPVDVQSDHKPLETIVRKPLQSAPKRLQRMLLRLQCYDINLTYRPGNQMELADTLSRAPLPGVLADAEQVTVNMLDHLPIAQTRIDEIRDQVKLDSDLQQVYDIIWHGWPEQMKDSPEAAKPYFHCRDELTIQDGIIFRGERVVIPKVLRKDLLVQLHASHIGTEGCLRRARECIYWPGMNSAVKDHVAKCDICRGNDVEQAKEPMLTHSVPDRPWSKVGTDLFVLDNHNYLVTVDYFSNFWEIDHLTDTKSLTVINKLKGQFARHGIPNTCVSDNGPQFSSEEFQKFARDWNFSHITSSPAYPQSNGKAEQAVKMAKSLLKKAKQSKSDPYMAILDFRNTPTQGINASPAQRLMSRRTRTLLPTSNQLLSPEVATGSAEKLVLLKRKATKYYNKGAKHLPTLQRGDSVRISPKTTSDKLWRKAEILGPIKDRPRSYEVRTEDNVVLRRNRRHLRKTSELSGNL